MPKGIKCDVCGKFSAYADQGWLEVSRMANFTISVFEGHSSPQITGVYCSHKCLVDRVTEVSRLSMTAL